MESRGPSGRPMAGGLAVECECGEEQMADGVGGCSG